MSLGPSLTEREIYMWTNTAQATAPCLVRDVFSMKENDSEGQFRPNTGFYWLKYIPCRTVLIIGVVVGIQESDKWTVYTVDDSMAVIECILCHPLSNGNLGGTNKGTATSLSRPPSFTPITAIGYLVQVIGKVAPFRDTRQIKAASIKPCDSTNDQWIHVKTVVELHKSKYAIPRPFQIPTKMDSDKLMTHDSLKHPLPVHVPSSPLTHSTTSVPSSLVDLPKFLHPSRLHMADLTDVTFQSYLEHYIQHSLGDVPCCDLSEEIQTLDETPQVFTSRGFTLSHLRRIPELALLANRVVNAELRRRARPDAEKEKTDQTHRKSFEFRSRHTPQCIKMKHLFMWAILKLYEEGSIVLYVRPLPPCGSASKPLFNATLTSANSAQRDTPFSSVVFSSPDSVSSKSIIPQEDAYLSDVPPYEEDEAYVPVTAALLEQPVREIMSARGIGGKSTRVSTEDIAMHLKKLDSRWACVTLQAVEEAIDIVVVDESLL
ncbi:uncharacterized protein F5891DRAFT_953242 [Suillus fuscotomentosus]|uniref:CST complex subunit STN1 n=1 Tax=Suillus fuscotomentosus TaxID=1912939 RepID=A0AAD4HKF1_9AGAM|nr:uncharacterized protein F5891DRAFT_953242 [Suillus fuscotomentosus]KAG1899878.1 hypothetical protein F5891DRAFT_953242 [Suillus fuscotomentosus]